MNTKFCTQCGHKLEVGHKFCAECGDAASGKSSPAMNSGILATQGQKSGFLARETLIVIGAIGIIATGFFMFKKQAPLPVPDGSEIMDNSTEQLSMAMIDALPQDYSSLVQKGNEYMDQGEFAVASEIYSRALIIDGSSSDVRTDYGACLHGMGMPERAIEEFKKVIASDPSHAIAHFNVGIVYNKLKVSDSAIAYFQHYLDKDPNGRASERAKQFLKEFGL